MPVCHAIDTFPPLTYIITMMAVVYLAQTQSTPQCKVEASLKR